MNDYCVDQILVSLNVGGWAVLDGEGNEIMRFDWDRRHEAEALAKRLNAAWRNGHAEGVSSVTRPRLAPKHVEELRGLLRRVTCGDIQLYPRELDAVLTALEVLEK